MLLPIKSSHRPGHFPIEVSRILLIPSKAGMTLSPPQTSSDFLMQRSSAIVKPLTRSGAIPKMRLYVKSDKKVKRKTALTILCLSRRLRD